MMQCSIQSILSLIAVLKTVTGTEEVIYAQVGKEVTLNAPSNSNSAGYIYWVFDNEAQLELAWINRLGGKRTTSNEAWKTQVSLSGDSLVIKDIQEENFGTYIYKENSPSVTVMTYKLHKLSVLVEPDSLLPGDTVSLKCNVETPRGQKQPDIYWLTPRGEKKRAHETQDIVAKTQDSGEWTCVVANGQKEHKVKIFVTVVDFSPAHQLQYTSTTSKLNMAFSIHPHNSWEKIKQLIKEIQCSFTPKTPSNNPQKLFTLSPKANKNVLMDQTKQLQYKHHLGQFWLFREKGKEDDQGEYKCTITSTKGKTLTSTVQVEVLQIIPSPGVTLTYGQRLELTCTTGEQLPPDVQLKWSPPKKSPFRPENSSNLLILKEVRMEDGGLWKCELWRNTTRLTSAVIKLNIEPVLSVWMLVTICSAGVIIILLVVLTVILCRRRKRNGRHLRHRLCRCENPKPKGFYRT